MFVVLAMVLRQKPDVLVSQLTKLRDDSKYQGQDKLPVYVWMICQVCDLRNGMNNFIVLFSFCVKSSMSFCICRPV